MPHAQPSDVGSADRILVYGATGSGKSTMALALGERLDLPVTLVDDLAWDPDWVQVSPEVFEARFRPRLESPSWVIDTVYGLEEFRAGVDRLEHRDVFGKIIVEL